jgi:hypothetical protein
MEGKGEQIPVPGYEPQAEISSNYNEPVKTINP